MRTLSFFISSTFRDMDFERDCLNKIVAPRLQEYYLRYGYSVRFFDLRWGVIANNESQIQDREKKILRTCFNAIDDCQPFFIALLGHRYGWIPENKKDTSREESLDDIFKKTGIDNPSVTAMEIAYGIIKKHSYDRSLVFIREKASYKSIKNIEPYYEHDTNTVKYAEQLKDVIQRLFSENYCEDHIIHYDVNLGAPSESIPKMVNLFETEIRKCVDEYIKIDSQSRLKIDDVLSERALFHYSLPKSCKEIVKEVLNGHSAIIYGNEGYGKTSLSFFISNVLKKDGHIVLLHSVGYSDTSYDPHEMIWNWNCQLEACNVFSGERINKLNTIEDEWRRFYSLQGIVHKKITIIIDSIDRMQDGFCNSNLMIVLPSNIQFILLSKEKLLNWEFALKCQSFKLSGINKEEALDLLKDSCDYHGKVLSVQIVDKILLKLETSSQSYSPLILLSLLDFLLGMDAEDFEKIRNSEGESEENKITNYMTSFIDNTSFELFDIYNRIIRDIVSIYGVKALIPLKVLSLSRDGLNEDQLHQILGEDFDLLQFTITRQLLHSVLSDFFASKAWRFKQDTAKRAVINYNSSLLPSNEFYLRIMSEASCLNEKRIYYAVVIQNSNALLQCLSTYDEEVITRELMKAIHETSLNQIFQSLKKCINNDVNLVDKVFRLYIFRIGMQLHNEKILDQICYWNGVSEALDNSYSMSRERKYFLKARVQEILGGDYKSNLDYKKARNCYLQATNYYDILDMKVEKEKCIINLKLLKSM